MEADQHETTPNTSSQDAQYSPGKQIVVGVSVVLILLVIGFFGYSYVKGTFGQSNGGKKVLDASSSQISPIQAASPTPQAIITGISEITPAAGSNAVPSSVANKTCSKYGPAQKWDYLVSYTVKAGDTLQSVAQTQLHDASRVNEIIQLNGTGPYVVGSTLYLPPPSITKSSGNIKEVYGLLIDKNNSYWHISYSSDPKGLGILIPSFWFASVPDSSTITVGDCITVLFDDGNKVFSVTLQ